MDKNNIYSPPEADLGNPPEDPPAIARSNLASRWARLGASLIDVVLMLALYVVVFYGTDYWDKVLQQDISMQQQMLSVLSGFAIYLLFNGYLLHKRGQTIGKWVLGIKIVGVANSEILPLWKVFFVRYVPQVLVALIPVAGQLMILVNDCFIFRKDKRCVHDHIAGSKVIEEHAH